MKRVLGTVATVLVLLPALAGTASAAVPGGEPARDRLDVYAGEVARKQLGALAELGLDRHQLRATRAPGDRVRVEVILSGRQARDLRRRGVDLSLKRIDGETVAQGATEQAAEGHQVFRRYSGPGGLRAEFEQVAAAHPRIAKLVTIGRSLRGQDIVALKVTAGARKRRDGAKPSVLYVGAQHAREWITPEMVRRLMRHVVERHGGDPRMNRLLRSTELWFVPVANPDGYDWTFEPGRRLWRKNLRDNDGDGAITPVDGVDPNRNFPTRWGWDNEGSSPEPEDETYRGTAPASEPETRALDALGRRVGFEFLVNYHSAAELLLYGTAWQVATRSPDDVIYEAMAGDDADPAIPGYDPDLSAELYTANGDTTTHFTAAHDTLGFTPEMSTCEAASALDPDDEWQPEACGSVFEFPDDEALVQAEFERNLPFALSVARSAVDPDDPESVVGRNTPNFQVDAFEVSHGDPQTVATYAKRGLRRVRLRYRIDGGRARRASVSEWRGGERYGDEDDVHYAELRGEVRGTSPGDEVEAWFTGRTAAGVPVSSRRFTYTVALESDARVLVIADEDYTGVNPTYPEGTDAPKYAPAHVAALEAAGYEAEVWDVDAHGVPHDLGVLAHYDAVLWYLGDNRLTQDPEDQLTTTPFGDLPDTSVAERAQYLTIAVRDHLNDGGKLIHAGETAQYSGLPGLGDVLGGLYYGLNGNPEAECVISSATGLRDDCLLLADDFRQYWLGAWSRVSVAAPDGVLGTAAPLDGYEGDLGGAVVGNDNPLDEAGSFVPTSEILPPSEFPQFRSAGAAEYTFAGDPYSPAEGERYAGAVHGDSAYMRLTRTADLTAATSAQLRFGLSANVEPGYDHVIVEARTAGGDDWTTLPEARGASTTAPPSECAADGFLLATHPFLRRYLGGPDCTAPGTSGTWHSITGSTGGWREVAYDLSAFAGRTVEISISYVTDPAGGIVGAFVDDTRLVVDGSVLSADGFEGEEGAWSAGAPPEGSPPVPDAWRIGESLLEASAATSTDDTLLLGFGLEQLATVEDRAELVGRALGGLLGEDR